MATGNMFRNLVKFGRVIFEILRYANGQTNKQTNIHMDKLITILLHSDRGQSKNSRHNFCKSH